MALIYYQEIFLAARQRLLSLRPGFRYECRGLAGTRDTMSLEPRNGINRLKEGLRGH